MNRFAYLAILVVVASFLVPLQSQTKPKTETATRPTRFGVTTLNVPTYVDKHGALTAEGISDRRELTLYDDGGSLDCRDFAPDRTLEQREARLDNSYRAARAFVWEHWQSRKRGYIRMTGNSVDRTSTLHLFIEPDTQDNWRVVWKMVRDNNRVHQFPPTTNVRRKETQDGFEMEFIGADGSVSQLPCVPPVRTVVEPPKLEPLQLPSLPQLPDMTVLPKPPMSNKAK